jgi:hypothetical protein
MPLGLVPLATPPATWATSMVTMARSRSATTAARRPKRAMPRCPMVRTTKSPRANPSRGSSWRRLAAPSARDRSLRVMRHPATSPQRSGAASRERARRPCAAGGPNAWRDVAWPGREPASGVGPGAAGGRRRRPDCESRFLTGSARNWTTSPVRDRNWTRAGRERAANWTGSPDRDPKRRKPRLPVQPGARPGARPGAQPGAEGAQVTPGAEPSCAPRRARAPRSNPTRSRVRRRPARGSRADSARSRPRRGGSPAPRRPARGARRP